MDPNDITDATLVGQAPYNDPNATDPNFPGVTGLQMEVQTWQDSSGNQWDTFTALGPLSDAISTGTNTNSGVPGATPTPPATQTSTTDATSDPNDDGSSDAGLSEISMELMGVYGFPGGGPDDAGGQPLKFPVLPDPIKATFSQQMWNPRVIGVGEILMPGTPDLETIEWNCFFPREWDPTYCVITQDEFNAQPSAPDLAIALIWTMRFGMRLRLTIGPDYGIWNDYVNITGFEYEHRGGEPGDIYYTLKLKRSRIPVVNTVANPNIPNPSPTTPTNWLDPQDTPESTTDPSGDGANPDQVTVSDTTSGPPPTVADNTDRATAAANSRTGGVNSAPPTPPSVSAALPYNTQVQVKNDRIRVPDLQTGGTAAGGETLQDISERTGVSVENLKIMNPQYKSYDAFGDPLPAGEIVILKTTIDAPQSVDTTPGGFPVPGI